MVALSLLSAPALPVCSNTNVFTICIHFRDLWCEDSGGYQESHADSFWHLPLLKMVAFWLI